MKCTLCDGTLSEVPTVVAKTFFPPDCEVLTYHCLECGAIHSTFGELKIANGGHFARLTSVNGTLKFYRLEDYSVDKDGEIHLLQDNTKMQPQTTAQRI